MEWNRVKTILIAVLLVTCLVLGGNIVRQTRARKASEEQAVRNACTVAAENGLKIDPQLVLALPETGELLSAVRDTAQEQTLAENLLGGSTFLSEPGGGVSLFSGDSGRLSIRRGDALELTVDSWDRPYDEEELTRFLSNAGFALTDSFYSQEEGAYVFTQAVDGVPTVNCRLSCVYDGKKLTVTGRWLLETAAGTGAVSATRAELVLALSAASSELDGCTEVLGLTYGFELGSSGIRQLSLTPIWTAKTDAGILRLDTVTKKSLPSS